jgi:lactate dehydrogenase-like 2-hydroxyacid dehydrogenase
MKPTVLAIIPLSTPAVQSLAARYELLHRPDWNSHLALEEDEKSRITALVTNGSTGCTPQLLAQLPQLRMIGAYGAGYENVCVQEARAAGVHVTYAPGSNASTVADHAIALALAVARDICVRSAAVKTGGWDEFRSARPTLSGSVVGIVGMGRIGQMVAQRARAFGACIEYCGRAPGAPELGRFHADAVELARASDFLFVTCPGGPATYHLVNATVLDALGPRGFLINVARGSVVDSASLAAALKGEKIGGAALDVFEEEPALPETLRSAPRLVVTPHMAGRSPAAVRAQTEMLILNIDAALAGQECPHPVPTAGA